MDATTDLYQQNIAMRRLFIGNSRLVMQPLPAQSVAPLTNRQATFRLKDTGVLVGCLVTVKARVTNGSAAVATLANFGISNLLSRLRLRDLSNNDRIDMDGRSLHAINSARQEWGFGAAYMSNQNTGFGVNKTIFSAPVTIAAGASADIVMQYFMPASYSRDDLAGAILKNYANQRVEITLDVNQLPFSGPAGENPTGVGNAIYTCTTQAGAALSNYAVGSTVDINVVEYYYDGDNSAYQYLPPLDIGQTYELKTTVLGAPTALADFPIGYTSQRQTLSSYVVFDAAGTFLTNNVVDFTLKASSTYEYFRLTPLEIALMERQCFMNDTPAGAYYFNFRSNPINTLVNGGMELNMKATAVPAGSRVFHSTEAIFNNGIDLRSLPSLDSGG